MFNNFIANASLVDIPRGGFSFTWYEKIARNMSKLDRFLISEGLEVFLNIFMVIHDCHLSDHLPILLKDLVVDYEPSPLRVFNSWFLLIGLIRWWKTLGRMMASRKNIVGFKK